LDSIEGLSLKEHYIRYFNEVSKAKEKERFMFEGSEVSKLLCLFLRGSSVALRGKCEVCPPQDELNLSRSEEAE